MTSVNTRSFGFSRKSKRYRPELAPKPASWGLREMVHFASGNKDTQKQYSLDVREGRLPRRGKGVRRLRQRCAEHSYCGCIPQSSSRFREHIVSTSISECQPSKECGVRGVGASRRVSDEG